MNLLKTLSVTAALSIGSVAHARVVINEILYHPPDGAGDIEFVELHNPGPAPATLAGWKFSKGIQLTFPPGTTIDAGGYLVVAKNEAALQKTFNIRPAAKFEKALKNEGERIELVDATGQVVDSVRYHNKSPWPASANGLGASLERINPSAPGELAQNWAASKLPDRDGAIIATPGQKNLRHADHLPPAIQTVRINPPSPAPNTPIRLEVEAEDADGIREVRALYRLVNPGRLGPEQILTLTPGPGKTFTGTLPAQPANQLLRYRIVAVDQKGAERSFPDPEDLLPTLPLYVFDPAEIGRIPLGRIVHVDPAAMRTADNGAGPRRGMAEASEEDEARMAAWQQMVMGAKLDSLWAALVFKQTIDPARLKSIKAALERKQADWTTLIDATLEAPDILDKVPQVPKLVSDFNDGVLTALQPLLEPPQLTQLKKDLASASSADANAESILRQIAPVERVFLAASLSPGLTDGEFASLKAATTTLLEKRKSLTAGVTAAMSGKGDMNKIQSEVMNLRQSAETELIAKLNADAQQRVAAAMNLRPPAPRGRPSTPGAIRGAAAYVQIDPATRAARVYDYIHIRPRSAGHKLKFHDAELLDGMSAVNLIFETKDRFVLAEHLAYELYHRAGSPAPASGYVRLNVNGRDRGYHLRIEQPNSEFLRRNKIATGGNMYKLLWFGQGVAGQHEKKNNPETGHRDIIDLISQLERTRGPAQWDFIRQHFDVEQVINYFAVNMCLTHWDGFFNNYFTYHDVKGTGKWQMYPWDQDKTWGYHDGLADDGIFWDMPVTFGMNTGDARARRMDFGGWWRPPGYFSGPLLANPQFRKHFLARTRQLLDTVYTPAVFNPVIDDLGKLLEEEVVIRARAVGENPTRATRRLATNLQLFKTQLAKRREFLLADREIQQAGPFVPAQLK